MRPEIISLRSGDLHIEKQLGVGQHGAVLLAKDKENKQLWCVKSEKDPERAAYEAEAIQMFYGIDSEVIEHEGLYYFKMPFFKGKTLDKEMAEGLTLAEKVLIIKKISLEVDDLHKKGLMHRDLKADNIIINRVGGEIQVNLIDLGRSVKLNEKNLYLRTNKIKLLFQPQVAPEYLYNGTVDTSSDIYSIGRITDKLFQGRRYSSSKLASDVKSVRKTNFDKLVNNAKSDFEVYKITLISQLILIQTYLISKNVPLTNKTHQSISSIKESLEKCNFDDEQSLMAVTDNFKNVYLFYKENLTDSEDRKDSYEITILFNLLVYSVKFLEFLCVIQPYHSVYLEMRGFCRDIRSLTNYKDRLNDIKSDYSDIDGDTDLKLDSEPSSDLNYNPDTDSDSEPDSDDDSFNFK
ncbi:MAG: protein kinase [Legionellaceae bacterium]|nr:protein kinase [Legionellaceae bacterium]